MEPKEQMGEGHRDGRGKKGSRKEGRKKKRKRDRKKRLNTEREVKSMNQG